MAMPVKRILVIGETGMGKSSLMNAMKDPTEHANEVKEVAKKGGYFVAGLLFFDAMFYAMYLEGEVIMPLLCGIPLGLMTVAIASQCVMHFLGLGTMVMNEGEILMQGTPDEVKGNSAVIEAYLGAAGDPLEGEE